MNRKLLLIILGVLLIASFIPWNEIKLWEPKKTDCQYVIDSLEAEMNEAKMNYMRSGDRINELNDSLYQLTRIINTNNHNYAQLKKQNEKLQKERSALINSFSDEDIERYLSKRYDR
jgi:chromosome segregation ATPase